MPLGDVLPCTLSHASFQGGPRAELGVCALGEWLPHLPGTTRDRSRGRGLLLIRSSPKFKRYPFCAAGGPAETHSSRELEGPDPS